MIKIDDKNYLERCYAMYDNFLNSSLVCFNPFEKSDEEVVQEIKERSFVSSLRSYLGESESFCAVFKMDGSQEMEWNGYKWEEFVLSPIGGLNSGQQKFIKESDFRYYINVDTGFNHKFIDDPESNRFSEITKISTINGCSNVRFCNNDLYLFDYYISGRDGWGKARNAYRFFRLPNSDCERPNFYRQHLVITKAFVLNYIIKYPKISSPSFSPICLLPENDMFLLEQGFNKKYRPIFENLLAETLIIMDDHNIPHPEKI